jgi:hypothetical protein
MLPGAKQCSANIGCGRGIGQWTNYCSKQGECDMRRERMENALGRNVNSLTAQLNYAWKDLSTKRYAGTLTAMQNATSVSEAAHDWQIGEGCTVGDCRGDLREQYANDVYGAWGSCTFGSSCG